METVPIVLEVPEDLLRRAQAVGMTHDDLRDIVIKVLERLIREREIALGLHAE